MAGYKGRPRAPPPETLESQEAEVGADELCSRVVAKGMTSSAAPPTLDLPSNRISPRSPVEKKEARQVVAGQSVILQSCRAVTDRFRLRSSS